MRRPLSALDLFKAALAAEDETAVAVTAALKAAGLAVAPHSNHTAWKPGMVSNIGGIISVYRQRGEHSTLRSLAILAHAFHGEVLQYAGTVFPGIVGVLADQPSLDDAHLIGLLRSVGQRGWRSLALKRQGIHHNENRELSPCVTLKRVLYNMYENESPHAPQVS